MLTFSKWAEPTFSINGFNNWRKALQKFHTHQASSSHREAILKWEAVQNAPISAQLTSTNLTSGYGADYSITYALQLDFWV